MDELRFDGRVVIVTGAARGLGREHALLLAQRGAAVVANDLGGEADGRGADPGPAEDLAREIRQHGGRAVANVASVATPEGAASIVETALTSFGRLDAVINNAGIHRTCRFEETPLDDFHAMLEVHYLGTLHVTRAAWPYFAKSGYGRIVNTTSSAILGQALYSAYCGAKGAIWALTRSLAVEGAEHGIRANALAPGGATRLAAGPSMSESFGEEVQRRVFEFMHPRLAAPAAAFLAHEACSLSGELVMAAGGRVTRLFIGETEGYVNRALTIEDVRDNLPRILDESGYRVHRDASESVAVLMERVATA
jgi:NAD(P)-dependent dehydrogenase (short-subunit alcohol dehydrogenase family)